MFLDAGGVEGPIAPELLQCLAVLSPNETELARLTGKPTGNLDQVGTGSGLVNTVLLLVYDIG